MYLYGIIEDAHEANLGIAGVDGVNPAYVVSCDGLGCVLSSYAGEEFGTLSKEELVRRLLRHQQVVERVMQDHTVLPVKFGTTLEGFQDAQALLVQGRHDLAKALESMRDKIEVEVAATWDVAQVLGEVSREEEVVCARAAVVSHGDPMLEDKVALGQVVKACLDRRRDAYRERVLASLKLLAVAVAPNALVSEEMVMNVAFLLERGRQREFDERVQELDRLFQDQITFRIIGPLPPYSFSTVEVARLTAAEIGEARKLLELGDTQSEAEVRTAYRRLAAREQRQAQPGRGVSGARLTSLRRASEALLAYCRARKELSASAGQDWVFVVSIKGTNYQEVEAARFGAAIPIPGTS